MDHCGDYIRVLMYSISRNSAFKMGLIVNVFMSISIIKFVERIYFQTPEGCIFTIFRVSEYLEP